MATNKRKEAAALFELIDKSTLKVPKHAGALKIPEWWSSKTNPATENTSGAADTSAKAIARTISPAKTSPATPDPSSTETPSPTSTARLFEPPPASATPAASPSIRPPMPAGTARPTPAPAPSAPVEEAPPLRATEPIAESDGEDEAGVTRRSASAAPFGPMRAAGNWSSTTGRRMTRRPPWVMPGVIGAAVLFLLIVILVVVAGRHGNRTSTANRADDALSGATADRASDNAPTGGLLPRPGQRPSMPTPMTNDRAPALIPNDDGGTAPESTTGKVYGTGTVQRSPDLVYVRISATPSLAVAQKNAEFLAQHGVDVSIEVDKRTHWYVLLSVKGFPSMVAGEPFRKQIVQIGHLHPDFKKYKKVWDDAFLTKVMPAK